VTLVIDPHHLDVAQLIAFDRRGGHVGGGGRGDRGGGVVPRAVNERRGAPGPGVCDGH